MGVIFISYRRTDSEYAAGRIYDVLADRYGAKRVFKDVEKIAPGTRWVDAVDEAMRATDTLLVVIGPSWRTAADPTTGRPGLDDPSDELRREVAAALANHPRTKVLPVLIGGAAMPAASELPGDLQDLTRRQAIVVRGEEHFHRDMDTLMRAISEEPRRRAHVEQRGGGRLVGVGLLVLVLIGGGVAGYYLGPWRDDPSPVPGPVDNGERSHLDELWDRCAGEGGVACDELFHDSPPDSEYRAFAETCGGRTEPRPGMCGEPDVGAEMPSDDG